MIKEVFFLLFKNISVANRYYNNKWENIALSSTFLSLMQYFALLMLFFSFYRNRKLLQQKIYY